MKSETGNAEAMNAATAASIESVVAAHRDEEIRFLAELVKVPSDNPPGDCAPHAERAAALLEAMGFAVERHAVPADEVAAHGMISCTNLVVRVRFGTGRGPVVALNAHGDVVPPGLGWTADPYGAEIRDGFMFGRGVAVSKSDFATYAFALRALQYAAENGARLDGTVELHFTYDEEAGGALGPEWLLARNISKPDYAISAGFSYGIITAHNGCLHLEVEVTGRSGHAAEPEKGVDALEAATGLLTDLYALRKTYSAIRSATAGIGAPTLVVGSHQGRHQHQRGARQRDLPHRPADHPRGEPGRGGGRAHRADSRVCAALARRCGHGQAHPAGGAVRADSRPAAAGRRAATARQCDHGRGAAHARRADLYGRAVVHRRQRAGGALRCRPTHAGGSQRPSGRRETEAR